jgi:LacI family transcriptional regulator
VLFALDHYMQPVHRGAADFARQAGWRLEVRPNHLPQLPPGYEVDGVITYIGRVDYFGPAVRALGVPIVNTSPWGASFGFPSVQLDNVAIGRAAADHLMDRGFRDLCMVQFMPTSLTSAARRLGFAAAVEGMRRRFHSLVPPADFEYAGAVTPEMLGWLPAAMARLPKPLGVLAEGDDTAVELIAAFQQMGLRVPDDVAVLGVDNDPLITESGPVPTSSVDTNLYQLGYAAASMLEAIMSGEPPPAEPVMVAPLGVVERESTRAQAFGNDEVAVAVRFIHARFRDPIGVADVAREAVVSRRRLQDLFGEHVGRSVLAEITRCRVEMAKRMLTETPMKIGLIAERCGLGSGAQMSKVFLREMNVTPTDYRDRHGQRFRQSE